MQVISNITIDLIQSQVPPIVYAKQYDENARYIYAALTQNGSAYTIPTGVAAMIKIAKPDGTYCFYDSDEANNPAVIIDGSKVQVRLVAAALQAAGTAQAEINLYTADTEKLTSFTFTIQIQASTVPDNAISTTYVNILTALVQQAIAAAGEAEASAVLAESWAVGGTDTRTGEDTNNSKYWSEQSQSAATGAIKYDEPQTLEVSEQAQARENIAAQENITAAGILKGDGTNVSAAVAGTDYSYPTIVASAPPTALTAGAVGQLYTDTVTGYLYQCTAAGSTYMWVCLNDVSSVTGVLPVTNGGTGAVTAALAREVLSVPVLEAGTLPNVTPVCTTETDITYTITENFSRYIRVGALVYAYINFKAKASREPTASGTTDTNYFRIDGLPFATSPQGAQLTASNITPLINRLAAIGASLAGGSNTGMLFLDSSGSKLLAVNAGLLTSTAKAYVVSVLYWAAV